MAAQHCQQTCIMAVTPTSGRFWSLPTLYFQQNCTISTGMATAAHEAGHIKRATISRELPDIASAHERWATALQMVHVKDMPMAHVCCRPGP